jgi:hypothetical protein
LKGSSNGTTYPKLRTPEYSLDIHTKGTAMGDKSKKDKDKSQKQKTTKQGQKTKATQDRNQKKP